VSTSPADGSPLPLDVLESTLIDLLDDLPKPDAPPRGPGREPVFPAFVLWAGMLIAVVRGFSSERKLWQLLTLQGLWCFPATHCSVQAFYQRLATLSPIFFQNFLEQLTAVLQERFATVNDVPYARFAADIIALDHCTLDPLLRKLKLLRTVASGDARLLPGRLAVLFDVRRQMWRHVEFQQEAKAALKWGLETLIAGLAPGTLLLFDVGYFRFPWFDQLTRDGFFWISRLPRTTSFRRFHTLFASPGATVEAIEAIRTQEPKGRRAGAPTGVQAAAKAGRVLLRDSWIYLGAHRADRAAHPVRLIEIIFPDRVYRYVTNVLDPRLLPAAHVVGLYRRRWGVERAFQLLKCELKLFVIWSGYPQVIVQQVFAFLCVAQVLFALRTEVALAAAAPLRDVSLADLLVWMPQLAAAGKDPIAELAKRGRQAGIIRPYRTVAYAVPAPDPAEYEVPEARPPPQQPRQSKRDRSRRQGRDLRNEGHVRERTVGWGKRSRRARCH
jgi:hypothetical protein